MRRVAADGSRFGVQGKRISSSEKSSSRISAPRNACVWFKRAAGFIAATSAFPNSARNSSRVDLAFERARVGGGVGAFGGEDAFGQRHQRIVLRALGGVGEVDRADGEFADETRFVAEPAAAHLRRDAVEEKVEKRAVEESEEELGAGRMP